MLKRSHGGVFRSAARLAAGVTFERLESRQFLNAAPTAPGFPEDDGLPGWSSNIPWPRFAEAAVYVDGVPTLDITYDQLLALSQATDAEGDTIYFLYGADSQPSGATYDDTVPYGILGSNGEPLDTPYEWNDLSRFDHDGDGIPSGDYVLEPGETWRWRGVRNMGFTGSDFGPPWGGPGDFGPYVVVTDNITRPAYSMVSSYISISGNKVMRYTRTDDATLFPKVDLGHQGTVTLTYEEIIAALEAHGDITDPEGAPPLLVITPAGSVYSDRYSTSFGTMIVGGVNINQYIADHHPGRAYPLQAEITADSPFVLGPGESFSFTNSTSFDDNAANISLWDGASASIIAAAQFVKATDNQLPSLNEDIDLGTLDAGRNATWTYEELVAMLNPSDADGDQLVIRIEILLDVGEVLVNGHNWGPNPVLSPGDVVQYTASGFQAGTNGFVLHIDDGWTTAASTLAFSAADFPYGDTDTGDTLLVAGGSIASATSYWPYGTQIAGWRNAAGELIVSVEDVINTADDGTGTVTRTFRNLSRELGLPALTADPIATGNYGGELYVPTVSGLLAIGLTSRHDTQEWSPTDKVFLRNLTTYNALVPQTELTLLTPPTGLGASTSYMPLFYGVTGYSSGGDLVIMYDSSGMYGSSGSVPVFNVTQAVQDRGLTMPAFDGGIAAYAHAWGGYNIVGLDGAGDLVGVWTGDFYLPGEGGYNNIEDSVWEVSNLSQITGAPRMVGAISVFSTDWYAINIIGTSEAGHAAATWWAPQLGDGNWSFVDFTAQFDGVPLAANSLTGWVAPWGALNVAGIDDNGQVQVYWWFPSNMTEANPEGWIFESLDSPTFSPTTALTSDAAAFHNWNDGERYTRMSLFGADETGRVGFTYWEPALGTEWAAAWA
ncbi:MAG: hypothetical protein GIKADHBN_03096 [Phycisphaerales bacterium]|nr:hypothetical protein [Phycisphaerales bacterium]